MRKSFIVGVVGLLLTSAAFAGFGKLNVWVRDKNCNVVDRTGHLHIYNCQGNQVLVQWFHNGHAEVTIPPGCYILKAGVLWGNIYTDKTMVVVKCGEEICVNLVLPNFSTNTPPPRNIQPLTLYYCPNAFLPPLILNAARAGITPGELHKAIDVIARAANMDKENMLREVKTELEMWEENIQQFTEEEQKEVKNFLGLMKKMLQ